MKALVGAFNQEKALEGAFSVIVQPFVVPMDRFTALYRNDQHRSAWIGARRKKYRITRWTRRDKRLFVWADNSPVLFDDWRRGEPNGDHEGCTVVWYKNNYAQGVWNDIPCHAKVRSLQ